MNWKMPSAGGDASGAESLSARGVFITSIPFRWGRSIRLLAVPIKIFNFVKPPEMAVMGVNYITPILWGSSWDQDCNTNAQVTGYWMPLKVPSWKLNVSCTIMPGNPPTITNCLGVAK